MTKTELISAVADQTGCTKKSADEAVNAIVSIITDTLAKGDKVSIVGFGTFEARVREARTGKNPRTGEILEVPASRAVKFKVGAEFKKKVNA